MPDGTFQKIKAKIYCKASEILLVTLLTVAISIFVYTLNAQAKQEERLRDVETNTALNTQTTASVKEILKTGDKVLGEKIDAVLSATNSRFDTLEKLLKLAIGGNRGEK